MLDGMYDFLDEMDEVEERERRDKPKKDPIKGLQEMVARRETRIKELENQLAECYRLSGADPDGDDDAMLAKSAVAEVKELRARYDVLESQLACAVELMEFLVEDTIHRFRGQRPLNPEDFPCFSEFEHNPYKLFKNLAKVAKERDERLRGDLIDAFRDIYYSAHWTADRETPDNLWEKARDVFGFDVGLSPEKGGDE